MDIEQIRVRIMSEAYDFADRGDLQGYNSVKVMCSDVLQLINALVAAERDACAELVWPTQQFKVWSDEELTAMTGAFNRAQEKHGWYETIMAVGAAALKGRAAAIRARGEK